MDKVSGQRVDLPGDGLEKTPLLNKGSLFGALLLVAGCCIGAGMLGLPVLTAEAGFKPSLLYLFFSWLFMTVTGLLFLEVTLSFSKEVNYLTMAQAILGKTGKMVTAFLYIFLFFSLLVAYIAGSGQLLQDFLEEITGYVWPLWVCSLSLTLFVTILLLWGIKAVDECNRLFMLGLVVSYVLLIVLAFSYVERERLLYVDWKASFFIVPPILISFGYHNLIPTLTAYLGRDVRKLYLVFILGSFIPLVVYALFEYVILGLIPLQGHGSFEQALSEGSMTTRALKTATGVTWIVHVTEYFAFFAIVTSLLGVALSFLDFLADGFHVFKSLKGRTELSFLALLPPFLFALYWPEFFLEGLHYAGAFGAVILFGILPALMVYIGRYRKKWTVSPIVRGGPFILFLIIALSLSVVGLEITRLWFMHR